MNAYHEVDPELLGGFLVLVLCKREKAPETNEKPVGQLITSVKKRPDAPVRPAQTAAAHTA